MKKRKVTTPKRPPNEPSAKDTLKSEIRFYSIFLACFLVFWTFGYGHYRIPSESMQPTLEVGDRLYVSKFSYGYSRQDLPFGDKLNFLGDRIVFASLPKRGDVAVFRDKAGKVQLNVWWDCLAIQLSIKKAGFILMRLL